MLRPTEIQVQVPGQIRGNSAVHAR